MSTCFPTELLPTFAVPLLNTQMIFPCLPVRMCLCCHDAASAFNQVSWYASNPCITGPMSLCDTRLSASAVAVSIAGTRRAYPQMDGQSELALAAGYMLRMCKLCVCVGQRNWTVPKRLSDCRLVVSSSAWSKHCFSTCRRCCCCCWWYVTAADGWWMNECVS